MTNALFIVFGFVASIVIIPILIIFTYLHFRRRAITNQELKTLHNEISHIRADIEDIKEQIAEFIIKTN